MICSNCDKGPRKKPFYGSIELENGLTIPWLQFAVSEDEAIRVVAAQHVHVVRCWIDESGPPIP